jgi:hypothetical protein
MNELSIASKFLMAVASVFLVAAATHSIVDLTLKMADAAITAQEHDQMSYGAFSRQLWSARPGKAEGK